MQFSSAIFLAIYIVYPTKIITHSEVADSYFCVNFACFIESYKGEEQTLYCTTNSKLTNIWTPFSVAMSLGSRQFTSQFYPSP
jgi:hypothetical protein